MKTPVLPSLKHLPFGGAGAVESAVLDADIAGWLKDTSQEFSDADIHRRFLDRYQTWIRSSKLNDLRGLDAFPVAAFSSGTTEAFDKFYMKNHQRRFRIFRGEYMYHAGTWKNGFDWAYMDQDALKSNDAIIFSLPFSDTGEIHADTTTTLDLAYNLSIPVLVDLAFFGLCSGIDFDLDHPAITDLTFSLSKTFPVAPFRIGMRLTREDDDDSLLIYNKTNYVNRLGASVGLRVLDHVNVDYNVSKWRSTQESFCRQLDIDPSATVIFGIDRKKKFAQYNRGGNTNRLCFYRYLAAGQIPL